MPKFKNTYQIESARLSTWDYTWPWWYYVTICTKDMACFFGEVVNEQMQLSAIGEIVAEEWLETPKIRKNVALDEWKIMPNHLHGIIIITDTVETPKKDVETFRRNVSRETTQRVVSTNPEGLQANSLGSIIGQIKSVCTKRIWKAGFTDFDWQERFYDHIIRNDKDLHRIRTYIAQNALVWEIEKNHPENLPE
ncbi:MAG: transposase [Bacteroidetes bacterium]|nr:transposase [Bacteroidota bacterium]MCW5895016.1 transposase [Bacteroidota bacterium]